MADTEVVTAFNSRAKRSANPLCFIVDDDFVFRHDLAKELRRENIDAVEFSSSSRFTDIIDSQNPDIVLINLHGAAPHECVRALLALKERRYSGAVQLYGRCEPKTLESFNTIGVDGWLTMLPPLQKPVRMATLRDVIRSRKLDTAPARSSGVSLKDALAKKMVKFFYQPKIDLKTAVVSGAEAVARIDHPELGLLTPDEFLHDADEGALLDLSRLALLDALRASAHFHDSGARLQLAININMDNLLALPISDLVLLHRPESADWAGLLLEIPERQVINKIERLKARAINLQQAGVSLAIDNFGRGASSLDILNQVAFSEIKIDRSLVDGCATNSGNAKICKTLIQMAHNFGCRAVAVGISAEADFQTVLSLDCDMGQGFLLGKPMSVKQIDAMIANSGRAVT